MVIVCTTRFNVPKFWILPTECICAPYGSANNQKLTNSVALIRERTMPIERPPLVGEVSANFCGIEGCRMISAADPLRP
jgi:hypothetical protein